MRALCPKCKNKDRTWWEHKEKIAVYMCPVCKYWVDLDTFLSANYYDPKDTSKKVEMSPEVEQLAKTLGMTF